ncbi:hypothetical protein V1477_003847 [Vespula maculifrons]|uniref:Uncharacterized protein n=1 Tax=Vespula maculifrons TaxID=7453 RepID=A0ABD2CS84_VESMC
MSYFNSEIHSNDCTNQHIHSVIIAFFSYVDTDQNRSVHKSIIIYYDERLRCDAIACISRKYQNFFENDRRLNYRTKYLRKFIFFSNKTIKNDFSMSINF